MSEVPGNVLKGSLSLSVLGEPLAICRLKPTSEIPSWAKVGSFFSVTRTADELSIVCPEGRVPSDVQCEEGWRAMKIEGPLDFSLVGVLSSVTEPLAEEGVSVFAISTFDTDYILVKEAQLDSTIAVLRGWGHEVS